MSTHTINEPLKMPHTIAHLNAESFWWWQCNEMVLSIKFLTPPKKNPTFPSLISLDGFCGRKAQCFFVFRTTEELDISKMSLVVNATSRNLQPQMFTALQSACVQLNTQLRSCQRSLFSGNFILAAGKTIGSDAERHQHLVNLPPFYVHCFRFLFVCLFVCSETYFAVAKEQT